MVMGVCKKLMVSFGALDAIQNWKDKHPSTCMDILRHLHNESCDHLKTRNVVNWMNFPNL